MAKRGKTYTAARDGVDRLKEYGPTEAVSLVKSLKRAKFDESVEVHIRTGLNVRHADEQLRGTIALPHGLGKDVTIAVFARGDKAREAEEAGADHVGAGGGGGGPPGAPRPPTPGPRAPTSWGRRSLSPPCRAARSNSTAASRRRT